MTKFTNTIISALSDKISVTVKNQLHVCAEVKSLLRSDSRHQIVDWIFPGMFEENLFSKRS